MNGAIARVNVHPEKLRVNAEKYLASLNYKLPDYNSFHNIMYQMVEVINAIEESLRILKNLAHYDLSKALTQEYAVKEGAGSAAVEAPRGTLFYHLDIDERGYVKNANIITPTAQSLANMEDDVKSYLPRVLDLPNHEREKKLRALIRAYDPCISCAVH
jgi:coenzyme F420-reducing hydrogenase alpha subunit